MTDAETIEKLQAIIEAMHPLVMASALTHYELPHDGYMWMYKKCNHCDRQSLRADADAHASDCPVTNYLKVREELNG